VKSDFLAGGSWDAVFEGGMDSPLPDRLWTQLLDKTEVRSPWSDLELRLLEVKGLGAAGKVRS